MDEWTNTQRQIALLPTGGTGNPWPDMEDERLPDFPTACLPEDCAVIPFSAEKGTGRDELVRVILDHCEP